jgi:pyruvate dehydrogenase E2 component (dihydrolipoamide acetyltransferase)
VAAYEFRMPDLGEGVAEGEIVRWLVAPGQEVAEDDLLCEIQTDKATVEVPSPAAGVVSRILAEEGAVVPVGELLVVIGAEDALPGNASAAVTEPAQSRVQATPAVRRLAADLGVDLASLATGGPVTEAAVRAAAGGGQAVAGRREPLRGVRRAIAEHLSRSHREVPAVTVVEECDFTHLSLTRGELSYLPFVLHATAAALGRHPALNARLEGDEIVYLDDVHLGVAMQTEAGLMVPVVRDAAARTVEALAAQVADLGAAAGAGTLAPEQLRGSTFTVSSAGRLGGLFATPLVNHPEVAILGVHRISQRPVVIDGAILVREIGLVSCTFDHRVVDGAVASAFLLDVIAGLEGRDRYRPAGGAGPPPRQCVWFRFAGLRPADEALLVHAVDHGERAAGQHAGLGGPDREGALDAVPDRVPGRQVAGGLVQRQELAPARRGRAVQRVLAVVQATHAVVVEMAAHVDDALAKRDRADVAVGERIPAPRVRLEREGRDVAAVAGTADVQRLAREREREDGVRGVNVELLGDGAAPGGLDRGEVVGRLAVHVVEGSADVDALARRRELERVDLGAGVGRPGDQRCR